MRFVRKRRPQKAIISPRAKAQLLQFGLADFLGDRVIAAFFRLRLAVLGQNIFDELGARRVERFAGLFVHVDIEITRKRVFSGKHGFNGSVVAFRAEKHRERNSADAVRLVAETGISDREFVARDALDNRLRTDLQLHLRLIVAAV